ncbi:MAG: DinB family protein [Acidobacteriota bacterium]
MRKTRKPSARKASRPERSRAARRSRRVPPRRAKRAAAGKTAGRSLSDLKQQYLDRFVAESSTTVRVLKAYPPGQDDFRPHERSPAAVRIAHLFSIENGAVVRAARGEWTLQPNFPPPPPTVAEAAAAYERGARELVEAVRAMPDSRLAEKVTFFTGPRQMEEIPVLDVLWFMLLDSVHHRGQLSVYIRMAGGKVPSIYGPTADEPWR